MTKIELDFDGRLVSVEDIDYNPHIVRLRARADKTDTALQWIINLNAYELRMLSSLFNACAERIERRTATCR